MINNSNRLNSLLTLIEEKIYHQCSLQISAFKTDQEGLAYDACQYQLDQYHVLCRNAKITPKKAGQFVTFWKRQENGIIAPFHYNDCIDFYVVNVRHSTQIGQFVFPKSVLIKKGIISTDQKEGKRGFRVYPPWDTITSKQAQQTQYWQLAYFYEVNDSVDLNFVKNLYHQA